MEPTIPTSQGNVKKFIIVCVVFTLIALLGIAVAVLAASPPTGSIAVTTYDVTSGSRTPVGNVTVTVNSLRYPLECSQRTRTTASSGSNLGVAHFTGCPAGSTITSRRYQKYVIIELSRSGYQLAPNSPTKVGADKAASKGGSFSVRKNRTTPVKVYLIREGASGGGGGNGGGGGGGGSGGLGASPNSNTPAPCGSAYLPRFMPLTTTEVIASLTNPMHCPKKDSFHVS